MLSDIMTRFGSKYSETVELCEMSLQVQYMLVQVTCHVCLVLSNCANNNLIFV